MDYVLCDELLHEIFHRLPPSAYASVSLVSRRWLSLLRSSLTSLSLRLPDQPPPTLLPFLLSRYTSLSNLTLILVSSSVTPASSDHFLISLASSTPYNQQRHQYHRLRHLRFLIGPVSSYSLVTVSRFPPFRNLTSLQLSSIRTLSFRWLRFFPCLKEFSLLDCSQGINCRRRRLLEEREGYGGSRVIGCGDEELEGDDQDNFPLESLSLSLIRMGNHGFRWLWRRCGNLRCLHLRGCEGTGDGEEEEDEQNMSNSSFALRLRKLQHLELRTCRSIADRVLLQIADNCRGLNSLLLYDGGSRDGLRRFFRRCSPALRVLDFRLPLDLDNTHLTLAAEQLVNLTSVRLQSCCLVTGEGLRSIGILAGSSIEELVLVNCDVVEKEIGLLSFLGQRLNRLRRLDLSHNDMLVDRELGSMLASCKNLVDLRLRGCIRLTDASVISMLKCCELLETLDASNCHGISSNAFEFFIANARRLKRLVVEERVLSDAAKSWAFRRSIDTTSASRWDQQRPSTFYMSRSIREHTTTTITLFLHITNMSIFLHSHRVTHKAARTHCGIRRRVRPRVTFCRNGCCHYEGEFLGCECNLAGGILLLFPCLSGRPLTAG